MTPFSAATPDDGDLTTCAGGFLAGLVGRGIQLSRTPAMHEAEGRAQGLCYIYRLLDADRMAAGGAVLAEIVAYAEHFGFDGLNVTFPYKQEIVPLLTDLSAAARALGSVNTVVLRGGSRIGHNTDMWGFQESFREEMADVRRDTVLLLGAGGAGAAVAHALLDSGVRHLLVTDIAREKADALAARLAPGFAGAIVRSGPDLIEAAAQADGLVNATPVGMAKLPGIPLDPALLRPQCWVADIVYFPLETPLLAEARRRGCRTMNGQGMAVHQAALAFELFTGRKADVARMRSGFRRVRGRPAGAIGKHEREDVMKVNATRRQFLVGTAIAASAAAFPATAQDKPKLRFSAVFSEQDIRAEMMKMFADAIKDDFVFEGYYGGNLFKQGTELVALQRGNLEMGNIAPQDISKQIPAWSIVTAGYLFRDAAHLQDVLRQRDAAPR